MQCKFGIEQNKTLNTYHLQLTLSIGGSPQDSAVYIVSSECTADYGFPGCGYSSNKFSTMSVLTN